MNIINALKKYNIKQREFDKLSARIKTIDLKLENWDKLKASTISNMPIHHDTEHGDKIGDNVCKREELIEERRIIELSIAELNEFIIDVDSALTCLKAEYRYILEKTYKDNLRIHHFIKEYNEKFGIAEHETIKLYKSRAIKELLKL